MPWRHDARWCWMLSGKEGVLEPWRLRLKVTLAQGRYRGCFLLPLAGPMGDDDQAQRGKNQDGRLRSQYLKKECSSLLYVCCMVEFPFCVPCQKKYRRMVGRMENGGGVEWRRMRCEYHVVAMRTEPPSLCLDCGRAACKGCVTLGVDRRRQF